MTMKIQKIVMVGKVEIKTDQNLKRNWKIPKMSIQKLDKNYGAKTKNKILKEKRENKC
jgi:hypothetical protein